MRLMVRTRTVLQLDQSEIDSTWLSVVASTGVDDRSVLGFWHDRTRAAPARCLEVTDQTRERITYRHEGRTLELDLRNAAACRNFTAGIATVCFDVSGLAHHVWIPLLAAALDAVRDVRVVYAEPQAYRLHPNPASYMMFDLTDRFEGVAPLPGLARLGVPPGDDDALFVPFLGFEGARARHIASTFDFLPPTVPVVGVAGFRIELPTYTLACNRDFLAETSSFGRIRFARASCPFEAKRALEDISRDNPGKYLYVAPVGTKPHALGAALYALENPSTTELMYDYPIRRSQRTTGVGKIHIYSINRH